MLAHYQGGEEAQREVIAKRAIKRMANAGIIKGWGAWLEKYEEESRQRRMLAAAAARLSRPMLVACFSSWSASWQESEAGDAAYQGLLLEGQQKKLLQEQQARGDALEREVERLRREAEEQLATAAEAQRAALEAQLAEITDAYGDKERQERRLAVGMKAAKRIQNQGILRGWGAWHEQWEEKSRKMRMLAAASARLSRPMVVACMTQWREDWQNEHLSAGQQAHAAVIQQLKENHKQATAQARRESAAARIVQEEVISDLEAELRAYLLSLETVIPPKVRVRVRVRVRVSSRPSFRPRSRATS